LFDYDELALKYHIGMSSKLLDNKLIGATKIINGNNTMLKSLRGLNNKTGQQSFFLAIKYQNS
tara:strand:+ start:372 stop:560 length:189 start_codon:yes stop_codon:yes gene_type:complete